MATQTTNYITGDAAFAVNRQGVVVLWNSEAEKLLGYRAGEALGQRCWKLLAGQDVFGNRYCSEYCPLREMAVQHESVHGFQVSLKTADEGLKKFNISCLLVYDGPGNGLVLHICRPPEEAPEHANHHRVEHHHSHNGQRAALTQRELEVLELLAEGKTTGEIASFMCISEATARNHIQHTLQKLHAHNRLEAVVLGQRLDLI